MNMSFHLHSVYSKVQVQNLELYCLFSKDFQGIKKALLALMETELKVLEKP